jgi:hypothetical protein
MITIARLSVNFRERSQAIASLKSNNIVDEEEFGDEIRRNLSTAHAYSSSFSLSRLQFVMRPVANGRRF